jgi:hypothetical protein
MVAPAGVEIAEKNTIPGRFLSAGRARVLQRLKGDTAVMERLSERNNCALGFDVHRWQIRETIPSTRALASLDDRPNNIREGSMHILDFDLPAVCQSQSQDFVGAGRVFELILEDQRRTAG